MPRWILLVLLVVAVGTARAHAEEDEEVADPLEQGGEDLMSGEVRTRPTGTWVVVPYREGPLPCAAEGTRVPLGPATARVLANATHVQAAFDRPEGFTAFALDTGHAGRTLVMMQEHIAAFHDLVASMLRMGERFTRSGTLGILHPIEGTGMHDMDLEMEGGGIVMTHGDAADAAACSMEDGAPVLRLLRDHAAVDAGGTVHAVLVWDEGAAFLPRPLEGSTQVARVSLLFTASDDDARALQRGLEPLPAVGVAASLALGLLGLAWVARP